MSRTCTKLQWKVLSRDFQDGFKPSQNEWEILRQVRWAIGAWIGLIVSDYGGDEEKDGDNERTENTEPATEINEVVRTHTEDANSTYGSLPYEEEDRDNERTENTEPATEINEAVRTHNEDANSTHGSLPYTSDVETICDGGDSDLSTSSTRSSFSPPLSIRNGGRTPWESPLFVSEGLESPPRIEEIGLAADQSDQMHSGAIFTPDGDDLPTANQDHLRNEAPQADQNDQLPSLAACDPFEEPSGESGTEACGIATTSSLELYTAPTQLAGTARGSTKEIGPSSIVGEADPLSLHSQLLKILGEANIDEPFQNLLLSFFHSHPSAGVNSRILCTLLERVSPPECEIIDLTRMSMDHALCTVLEDRLDMGLKDVYYYILIYEATEQDCREREPGLSLFLLDRCSETIISYCSDDNWVRQIIDLVNRKFANISKEVIDIKYHKLDGSPKEDRAFLCLQSIEAFFKPSFACASVDELRVRYLEEYLQTFKRHDDNLSFISRKRPLSGNESGVMRLAKHRLSEVPIATLPYNSRVLLISPVWAPMRPFGGTDIPEYVESAFKRLTSDQEQLCELQNAFLDEGFPQISSVRRFRLLQMMFEFITPEIFASFLFKETRRDHVFLKHRDRADFSAMVSAIRNYQREEHDYHTHIRITQAQLHARFEQLVQSKRKEIIGQRVQRRTGAPIMCKGKKAKDIVLQELLEEYDDGLEGRARCRFDLDRGVAMKIIADAFGSELVLAFMPSQRVHQARLMVKPPANVGWATTAVPYIEPLEFDRISKAEANYFTKWVVRIRKCLTKRRSFNSKLIFQWVSQNPPAEMLQRIARMPIDSEEFLNIVFES